MKYSSIPLLIALLQLTACGGGGGSSSGPIPSTDPGVPPASTTNPESPSTPGEGNSDSGIGLEGQWKSACAFNQDTNTYETIEHTYASGKFTGVDYSWDNSSCMGSPIATDNYSGSYIVGNNVTTASGTGAYELDLQLSQGQETNTYLFLVELNDNSLYYANPVENGRPTEINYETVFTRQNTDTGNPSEDPGFPNEDPSIPGENPGFPDEDPSVPGENPGFPDEDPRVPSDNPGFPDEDPSVPDSDSGNTLSSLEGTWISTCQEKGSTASQMEGIRFNGNQVILALVSWRNSSCSGEDNDSNALPGVYSIGNQVTTSSGTTAYEIDMHFNIQGQTTSAYGIIEIHADKIYLSELSEDTRGTNIDYNVPYLKQ